MDVTTKTGGSTPKAIIIRLLPHQETNGLPEPEYALLDGFQTFYYVMRAGK